MYPMCVCVYIHTCANGLDILGYGSAKRRNAFETLFLLMGKMILANIYLEEWNDILKNL